MIGNKDRWRRWEAQGPKREPADFRRNLEIVEALYEHARSLGALPTQNPLAGLEVKIRLARVLNAPTPARTDRPRP